MHNRFHFCELLNCLKTYYICWYLVAGRRAIENCIWLIILILPQKGMNGGHVTSLSPFVEPQVSTDYLNTIREKEVYTTLCM